MNEQEQAGQKPKKVSFLASRIKNPVLLNIVEWLITLVIALVVFLVMRNFVFRVAHVTGSSMEPTLSHGDMVLLVRLPYLFSDPRVGDIVAFPPYPDNPAEFYIKRIVALPDDTVNLYGGAFYINELLLADEFSGATIVAHGDVNFPVDVPDGYYFVLGDNRNGSKDSRFQSVGNVRGQAMVGRVFIRLWPLGRFGRVD